MRNILLILMLFFTTSLIAQITELYRENVPRYGERKFMYLLDEETPSYSDINGENAFWDYSNVSDWDEQTLVTEVVPSESTVSGALFPPSDATIYGELMALYNTDDEIGMYTHGMVFNDPEYGAVKGVFNENVLICEFPYTLGDLNVSDVTGSATINSPQGNFTGPFSGTVSTSVDAIGTLALSNTTYENVVRLINMGDFTISAFGYNVILTSQQYAYYNLEVSNLPLFIHTYVMYKTVGGSEPLNEYVFVLTSDNPNQELSGPTFTSDNMPSVGEEQTMFFVSGLTDPLEDIVGENVTWDFSTILGSTILEQEITVESVNSTVFDQAVNSVEYEDVLKRYVTDNVYGSNIQGTVYKDASSNDITDFYGSNTQLYNYPFGYGADPFLNGFSGETSFTMGGISLDEKPMIGSTLTHVDGYGTLKLPYSDYHNVVRQKYMDTIRISQSNFPSDLLKIGTVYTYYDFELSNLPIFVHSKIVYKYENETSNIHRFVKVLSLEPPYECDIELTAEMDYVGECIDEDHTFGATLLITGGQEGDEFTIVDNHGNTFVTNISANEPFIVPSSQYNAGQDVTFTAYRNGDEVCLSNASIFSPEICYYCDVEILTELNYNGECVDSDGTFGVKLTITGGLPGDAFTLKDSYGTTLTTNISAGTTFVISSGYYSAAQSVSFYAHRNVDIECNTEVVVEPPLCYVCDIELTAEVSGDVDCLDEGETYGVVFVVSGGLPGDEFTIVDSFGETLFSTAVADETYTVPSSQYNAGEDVSFTVYRNGFESCLDEASVQSPEICYYCDIELTAEIVFDGDCIDEDGTFGAVLTITGGLPGDNFTIKDDSGAIYSTTASANSPFTLSNNSFSAGSNIVFIVNRNSDAECTAEASIESPEICYVCDIELSAQINHTGDCIESNETYGATLIITGGLADDTFTISDNYGNTLSTTAVANTAFVSDDLYNAGEDVTFTVQRNEDNECTAEASISSPNICYNCDYDLMAEVIFDEECIEEDGSYEVKLTIIGGQEGDVYTISDNINGEISSTSVSGEVVTVTYNAGDNPTFTLDRNDDLECFITISVQSPDICLEDYICDIELSAELNYDGTCVVVGSTYSITLMVSGGLPGDLFTITDNSGNILTTTATANNSFTTSNNYYNIGDEASFTVSRNDDVECMAEATIATPEICPCDIELVAEINFDGDCINEGETFGATLVITGGIPGDKFTIKDDNGAIFTTVASANEPFTISSNYYSAGTDVTFIVNRNNDVDCIAESLIESPEFCYNCDIELSVELDIEGDCVDDENELYGVTLTVTGGVDGDEFTIIDSNGDILTSSATAGQPFNTPAQYSSNDGISFTAYRNEDETCSSTVTAQLPEICYYCDIELTAVIDYTDECIDEDQTFGATLTITGGLPNDNFTIMDGDGAIFSAIALANEPFVIPSSYYQAGQDVNFIVYRNADNTCTAEASLESPEICYYCDIELEAVIDFDEDCIDEGETFSVTLTVSGGVEGDEFTIMDSNGDVLTTTATSDVPFVSSTYVAGEDVSFTVYRNEDETCSSTASVQSPEICYNCDIELTAETFGYEDCIEEGATYGVTLTISGGEEGDEFTIIDDNGIIFTTDAIANEPFAISSSLQAGQNANFTAIRNVDASCIAEVFVESPEICDPNVCDIIPVLQVEELSDVTALITWEPISGVTAMYVEWKESSDNQWNTVEVTGQDNLLLEDLTAETDYEVRAYVICDNEIEGELSDVLSFTTEEASGIEEELFVNVRLYPNPTMHELTIEIDNHSMYEIEINDMVGKLVYKGNIKDSQTIDINNFKPGVYLLNLKNKEWSKVFRFIKK